jgi:hypothetical protein
MLPVKVCTFTQSPLSVKIKPGSSAGGLLKSLPEE